MPSAGGNGISAGSRSQQTVVVFKRDLLWHNRPFLPISHPGRKAFVSYTENIPRIAKRDSPSFLYVSNAVFEECSFCYLPSSQLFFGFCSSPPCTLVGRTLYFPHFHWVKLFIGLFPRVKQILPRGITTADPLILACHRRIVRKEGGVISEVVISQKKDWPKILLSLDVYYLLHLKTLLLKLQ